MDRVLTESLNPGYLWGKCSTLVPLSTFNYFDPGSKLPRLYWDPHCNPGRSLSILTSCLSLLKSCHFLSSKVPRLGTGKHFMFPSPLGPLQTLAASPLWRTAPPPLPRAYPESDRESMPFVSPSWFSFLFPGIVKRDLSSTTQGWVFPWATRWSMAVSLVSHMPVLHKTLNGQCAVGSKTNRRINYKLGKTIDLPQKSM